MSRARQAVIERVAATFRSASVIFAMLVPLVLGATPARAIILFDNPFDPSLADTFWCDPCATGHVNAGYRVWDSFALASDSTLQSFRWIGLRTDVLSLGVNIEIANSPYGTILFSAHFADGSIARSNTGNNSSIRRVALPDVLLDAGTYWLTVYGPSLSEHHTWLGEVIAGRDGSLVQYGPDPQSPSFAIPRFQDARFRLEGELTATPLPGGLMLFFSGLIAVGGFTWIRRLSLGRVARGEISPATVFAAFMLKPGASRLA